MTYLQLYIYVRTCYLPWWLNIVPLNPQRWQLMWIADWCTCTYAVGRRRASCICSKTPGLKSSICGPDPGRGGQLGGKMSKTGDQSMADWLIIDYGATGGRRGHDITTRRIEEPYSCRRQYFPHRQVAHKHLLCSLFIG